MKQNYCYIHIPFCTSKCKYCRFASFGNIDQLKINLYVEKLIGEIKKSSFNIEEKTLNSIYFGGGTPSVLKIEQLGDIINALKDKYAFEKDIEISIEATPITITQENLIGWNELGINRLSIGVQSLNTDTLKEIGRGEKGDIINALDNIKHFLSEKNIDLNISIDIIIGLPYVEKGEVKEDILDILHNNYFVKHISVYMLEEYYGEGERDSKFQKVVYPTDWKCKGIHENDYLDEYIDIKETLKTKGFNSYEISNFAKQGYECKHNQSYWNHSNILAYGLGAHGFINNTRYSNSEEFLNYYSENAKEYEALDNQQLDIEKLMFGLRTSGIEQELYQNFDTEKISYFVDEGYLQKKSDKIHLSDKGVLLLDYILGELL
ncbi:MAG: radical SAM family heme chaperone HemW [Candidatus Gracilibacteria bacterium]|nr:radical SAM family heme chaperone HemW [Candidatus Gracilibacteria bacterium]